MKEIKKPAEGLSTAKAVLGIILSIAILAIAQTLAFVISEFLLNLECPVQFVMLLQEFYMWCWL